jgi:hypothetical protein
LLFALPASAQNDAARGAARQLGSEGVEAYQAGDYKTANDKLSRAFQVVPAPTLGLWSARALVKVGKLVEASERYLEVARLDASRGEAAVQKQAQVDAARERDELLPRIPSLTISVTGGQGEVVVSVDGEPLQSALLGVRQPANPGSHVLEARDGTRALRKEVSVAEGRELKVELDLATGRALANAAGGDTAAARPTTGSPAAPGSELPADQAQAKSGLPVGFWVGVAVGGVGLVAGGVGAGLGASKKSELDCADDRCPSSKQDGVDATNRWLTVSTVGFIVAGVGTAAAVTFALTAPKAPPQAGRVETWLGLGSAGVRGSF